MPPVSMGWEAFIAVRVGQNVAARVFEAALSLSSHDSHARFQLGALALASGRSEVALRQYEAGLEATRRTLRRSQPLGN